MIEPIPSIRPEPPSRVRPAITTGPLPGSRKVYVEGSRPACGCRCARSASPPPAPAPGSRSRTRRSPSTTPRGPTPIRRPRIDLRRGLPPAAPGVDRGARRRRGAARRLLRVRPRRAADPRLARLRFPICRKPLCARPGANVTQMHYARQGDRHPGDGVHRHPREPAPRAGPRAAEGRAWGGGVAPASGAVVRRRHPGGHHPRVRARRGGPRPGDHPGQRQPSGERADDHRPQLPGEDQRQHRQLGRHLLDRGGGGEAGLGDPLGRRHGDGPVDGQEHPRDPRVDPPQLARCRSAPCPSTRRWRRWAARPRTSPGRSTATR